MQQHNKNLIYSIIVNGFSYFLIYIVNLYLAHSFSPGVFGDINIMMRILLILSVIGLLGSDLGARKHLALYFEQSRARPFNDYFNWSIRMLFKMTFGISLIITVLVAFATYLHGDGYITVHQWHPLTFGLYLTPLFMASTLFGAILNSINQFILYLIPEVGFKHLIFLISLLFIHNYITPINLNVVIFALAFERVVIIAFQLGCLYFTLPPFTERKAPRRSWLGQTTPLMGTELMQHLSLVIDIGMLELLATNESVVGYYSAVKTITLSIVFFNMLFYPVLSPLIYPLLKQNKKAKLQSIIRSQSWVKLLVLIFINVILYIYGERLLLGFGPSYTMAYYPLLIVAIIFSINCLTDYARKVLLYGGYHHLTMRLQVTQFILHILFNAILIPLYSLWGVVLSTGLSLAIIRSIIIYKAHHKLKINLF